MTIDISQSPGRLPKRNVSPRYSEGSQTAHAFTPKVLRLRNCGLRPPGDTACGESIVFQVPGASQNGTCLPVVPKVVGEPVRFLPRSNAYVTALRSSPFPPGDRSRTLKIFTSPETERVSSVEGTERRRPANGRLAERVSGPGG